MLKEWLAKARESGDLVAYHKWSDDPSIFLVGFVREIREKTVLFDDVTSLGRRDTPNEAAYTDLHGLHRGSAYLLGLAGLHREFANEEMAEGKNARSAKTILAALRRAAGTEELISFWDEESERFTAFVREVADGFAKLEIVLDGGISDGEYLYRLDRIKRVRHGSSHELADRWLYDHRSEVYEKLLRRR